MVRPLNVATLLPLAGALSKSIEAPVAKRVAIIGQPYSPYFHMV